MKLGKQNNFNKKITFLPLNPLTHVDYDAPTPSFTQLPKWYKDIPLYSDGDKEVRIVPRTAAINTTIKACTPFLDGMMAGYTMVLADDIQIQRGDTNAAIYWRTTTDLISEHDLTQHPGLPVSDGFDSKVLKWVNQWRIQTPQGYSTLVTHPINRFDLPFMTFTGIVDTDKYPLAVQLPFRFKKDFYGIVERGTPIAQLFPFKRESWDSSIGKYNEEESRKSLRQLFGKIERSYKFNFWVKKSYK